MRPNWFIGWPVAPPRGLLAGLPPPPPGVRVFDADDLHATLAFLGPVDEDAARRAFDVAVGWTGPAITARLGPVVPLGRPGRPSALSAELVGDDGALAAVIRRFRRPIERAAGARPDARPPRPHVTLARPQRRASDAQRAAAVEWAQGLTLPETPLHLPSLALYTWARDRRRQLFTIADRHLVTR